MQPEKRIKSDFWTRSSLDLRKDSDCNETNQSTPEKLNHEEDLIYTHLQSERGKKTNLLGT